MICRQCCRAADNNQPKDHCSDPGCTCAHWPVGHCIPVEIKEGVTDDSETADAEPSDYGVVA